MTQRIVIVGAGFAGLTTARGLRSADVDVTLIDRTNHHLFQPLLYQVATGGLSPADIASPIRFILRRQGNARVLLDEVVDLDVEARQVVTHGARVDYDTLVVATGATDHYFGHEEWAAGAPGLKTLGDAIAIRRRVLETFETAERTGAEAGPTFVVVGGGPTGVEMAGAIAEMARHTLRHDFRSIDPAGTRVVLVEAADRLLGSYPARLSRRAREQLEDIGVEVRTGCRVVGIDQPHVTIEEAGSTEVIASAATVWAAGVQASPLGKVLARAGAELDRSGRVIVDECLGVPGRPEILVLGDLAHVSHDGAAVPGVAPAAIQMGRFAATLIRGRIEGRAVTPFRYRDKGSLATIGRSAAVAHIGRFRFGGFPAWVAWLAIHIWFLIGFENRLLVMIQWAWNYATRNRSARLIVDYRIARSRGDRDDSTTSD